MGKLQERRLNPVDLDGIATVRPHPQVLEALREWSWLGHAHPGSPHAAGARARHAIEGARAEVAALLGASADCVVFTSGAAEANNHAIKGLVALQRRSGRVAIAIAAHERATLLHPARTAAGADLESIPVNRDGRIDPERFVARLPTLMVLGQAHAELGTLQPAAALCAAGRRCGAQVHVDATLTAGRVPVDFETLGNPDLVTISFHHFGGPMGVGALLVREGLELPPLIEGGGEEGGRRAGSPNLAGIVGAGVAAALARREREVRERAIRRAAAALAEEILAVDSVLLTGPAMEERLPGHLSVTVRGVDGEALVAALDDRGILAATGSPCASGAGLRSAALRAAGYTPEEARSAVVLCIPPLGIPDPEGILFVGKAFRDSVLALRGISGG